MIAEHCRNHAGLKGWLYATYVSACRQHGILITAASRTPTPDVARAWLKKSGALPVVLELSIQGQEQSRPHPSDPLLWPRSCLHDIMYRVTLTSNHVHVVHFTWRN